MEEKHNLFMVMLGAKPTGRVTEQHDIFFGIGKSLTDLIPEMNSFWPEAKGNIHIDAWRRISKVENYSVKISPRNEGVTMNEKLFFINLGGYKPNEFEEFHYKVVTIATNKATAIKKAKQTSFYKHCGFTGATSHIDDKYGIDVDDIYNIEELLSHETKNKFQLVFKLNESREEDILNIGYLKIKKPSI
ncbi:DUF1543 domain-containing protein [Flavobacterium orientale]|uniref:DUF1543 domain-containing protein n=1 Tax=Flavobacterium orientale TaxID=1756020 RepID=A0A916Y9G5_9FLAO|nr:DUF1543 domain-containing protein [Flavobacterium orientale]GGD35744.1 hypothetical protein GCM10011343_27020 [Flavobacterium orientale]